MIEVLCWNCPRTSSGQFLKEMKEMMGVYKPVLIILLEPKVSGEVADGVCKNLGME